MAKKQEAFVRALSGRIQALRTDHYGPRGGARFARALGLRVHTYYKYEKGTQPPLEVLERMIEATGCSARWLIAGVGRMWDAQDAAVVRAFRETAAAYGPGSSVEQIRTEAMEEFVRRARVQQEIIDQLRRENDALRLRVAELEERAAGLDAPARPKRARGRRGPGGAMR